MTKQEFLEILKQELSGAAPDERAAALQYYSEYIDDAGPQREAEILKELGSPHKLAEDIRTGSGTWDAPQNTQNAAQETTPDMAPSAQIQKAFEAGREKAAPNASPHVSPLKEDFNPSVPAFGAPPQAEWRQEEQVQNEFHPYAESQENSKNPNQNSFLQSLITFFSDNISAGGVLKTILIVFAAIILVPLLAGLALALVGVLIAAVVLFVCPIIIGVALSFAAVALIVVGVIILSPSLGSGLLNIGLGVFLLAISQLCIKAGTRLLGHFLPSVVRGLVSTIKDIFGRNSAERA